MPAELHTTLTPDTPVRYLKGVGPKTAERFEKLGILTLSSGAHESDCKSSKSVLLYIHGWVILS